MIEIACFVWGLAYALCGLVVYVRMVETARLPELDMVRMCLFITLWLVFFAIGALLAIGQEAQARYRKHRQGR